LEQVNDVIAFDASGIV